MSPIKRLKGDFAKHVEVRDKDGKVIRDKGWSGVVRDVKAGGWRRARGLASGAGKVLGIAGGVFTAGEIGTHAWNTYQFAPGDDKSRVAAATTSVIFDGTDVLEGTLVGAMIGKGVLMGPLGAIASIGVGSAVGCAWNEIKNSENYRNLRKNTYTGLDNTFRGR